MDRNIPLIKVILIGNSGVGKTSILNRYFNHSFESKENVTLNSSFLQKTIISQNKVYKLEFWDTAGQEKFNSILKIFYTNAQIILLVYDITNKESFLKIQEYWYNEIINNAKNVKGK